MQPVEAVDGEFGLIFAGPGAGRRFETPAGAVAPQPDAEARGRGGLQIERARFEHLNGEDGVGAKFVEA